MFRLSNYNSPDVLEAVRDCKQKLAAGVAAWDSELELFGEPGSARRYTSAGQQLARMVRPYIHPSLQIEAFGAGLGVTGNLLHTCALLARQEGVDQPTLRRLAVGEDTYKSLLVPTKTTRKVANAIERVAGMRPEQGPRRSTVLDQYKISSRGFALKNPEFTADMAGYYTPDVEATVEHGIPAGNCPAPMLGLVRAQLGAMVQVADIDPSLFAATLQVDPT